MVFGDNLGYNSDEDKAIYELAERFRTEPAESDQVHNRQNANHATALFTAVVIDNKHQYQNDKNNYRKAVQAYCNILMYEESKMKIREVLHDISGLDLDIMEKIIQLSVPGKFCSFQRILPLQRVDEKYRWKFLRLLEVFAGTSEPYEQMMRKLELFANEMREKNRLYMTGLLSALQQDNFIPYTTRSAWPLQNTPFYYMYEDMAMKWYREFNDLYRQLSKYTGMTLLELDTVANKWCLARKL